jgi:mannonate dehydratase
MKIGLGLYREMLTSENFRFARQTGATHIVAHLTNYQRTASQLPDIHNITNWHHVLDWDTLWTYEGMRNLRTAINAEGLELAAFENFDPLHWHDILLDGPHKQEQFELLKTIIRNAGRAGILVIGYNFSVAGVWGHVRGPFARGGAESVAFLGKDGPEETPIPQGYAWNMQYDPHAPQGTLAPITSEQMWQRLTEFLETLVPVAEEAGVRLAAHPDDPPMPTLRGTPRLIHQPHLYQKLLDIVPSFSNSLEFCQGTTAEMNEGDVYEAIDQYSKQGKIAYVHFRNIRGKVPSYHEVFLDEGDVDMFRALRIYKKNGFDGVMIPDHTPSTSCNAPWHAGMAYALGYMRAAMSAIQTE